MLSAELDGSCIYLILRNILEVIAVAGGVTQHPFVQTILWATRPFLLVWSLWELQHVALI